MEYLTDLVTTVPEGTSPAKVDELRAAEAVRAAELAKKGHLVRLWRPPLKLGEWRSIGLFRAADEAELRQVLDSFPLHVWMKVTITPLNPHPNDPEYRVSSATRSPYTWSVACMMGYFCFYSVFFHHKEAFQIPSNGHLPLFSQRIKQYL